MLAPGCAMPAAGHVLPRCLRNLAGAPCAPPRAAHQARSHVLVRALRPSQCQLVGTAAGKRGAAGGMEPLRAERGACVAPWRSPLSLPPPSPSPLCSLGQRRKYLFIRDQARRRHGRRHARQAGSKVAARGGPDHGGCRFLHACKAACQGPSRFQTSQCRHRRRCEAGSLRPAPAFRRTCTSTRLRSAALPLLDPRMEPSMMLSASLPYLPQ